MGRNGLPVQLVVHFPTPVVTSVPCLRGRDYILSLIREEEEGGPLKFIVIIRIGGNKI